MSEQMVQVKRAEATAERMAYKDGWKFQVAPRYSAGGVRFSVGFATTNPYYTPSKPYSEPVALPTLHVDLTTEEVAALDDDGLVRVFTNLVRTLELHEMEEFLRVDGERITEPHPVTAQGEALQEKRLFQQIRDGLGLPARFEETYAGLHYARFLPA